MRWLRVFLLLVASLLLGACGDVVAIGGRSVEGEWRGTVQGERVWLWLEEDGRQVWGSGEWGYDPVYVSGDHFGSDVYLLFEFDLYTPIELEGVVRGNELEGRLYGSGLAGERVRFHRVW